MRGRANVRYRVYAEDEFLADPAPALPTTRSANAVVRGRRVAGTAMLAGAIGAVAAVTAARFATPEHASRARARHTMSSPRRVIAAARTARATIEAGVRPRRHTRGLHVSDPRTLSFASKRRATRDASRRSAPRSSVTVWRAGHVARPIAVAATVAAPPQARNAEFGFEH